MSKKKIAKKYISAGLSGGLGVFLMVRPSVRSVVQPGFVWWSRGLAAVCPLDF